MFHLHSLKHVVIIWRIFHLFPSPFLHYSTRLQKCNQISLHSLPIANKSTLIHKYPNELKTKAINPHAINGTGIIFLQKSYINLYNHILFWYKIGTKSQNWYKKSCSNPHKYWILFIQALHRRDCRNISL